MYTSAGLYPFLYDWKARTSLFVCSWGLWSELNLAIRSRKYKKIYSPVIKIYFENLFTSWLCLYKLVFCRSRSVLVSIFPVPWYFTGIFHKMGIIVMTGINFLLGLPFTPFLWHQAAKVMVFLSTFKKAISYLSGKINKQAFYDGFPSFLHFLRGFYQYLLFQAVL